MAIPSKQHGAVMVSTGPLDRKIDWLIFGVAFVAFLAIALVGATLGFRWRSWLHGAEGVSSVIGGVKAAVWTFMSQIE